MRWMEEGEWFGHGADMHRILAVGMHAMDFLQRCVCEGTSLGLAFRFQGESQYFVSYVVIVKKKNGRH